MDTQLVLNFVKENTAVTFVVGVFAFIVISFLAQTMGFHLWYLGVLALAGIVSVMTGHALYFWPFLLGMMTAFAEIINKFDDEPMKALKTAPALLYHVLNGLIAVFALYFLALVANVPTNFTNVGPMDQLKYALCAGLGAMLIMRSKLFNIKMGEEDVSFGPEQIIKTLFRFMESAIGRIRARARRVFIEDKLDNISFEAVYAHSVMTLRRAPKAFSPEKMGKCMEDLDSVKQAVSEAQLKSYELGYLIYDNMGEDFVSDVFSNPRAEWLLRAPDPAEAKNVGVLPNLINVQADNALVRAIPFVGTKEETVPYMAYGTNMSSRRIRERLNWVDSAGEESLKKTNPTKCVLSNYRLAFNKMSEQSGDEGLANVVSETGGVVEGVLYQLPKTAVEFVEQNEPGYHRLNLKVMVDGKPTAAAIFLADADKVGPELWPNRAELASIIEGAAEHGLSDTYLASLKRFEGEPAGVGAGAGAASRNGGGS